MVHTPNIHVAEEADLARERAALGAAILDPTGKQAGILVAIGAEGHFLSSFHRAVYRAISRLVGRGFPALDYATVIAELMDTGVFQQYASGWTMVAHLGDDAVLAVPMMKRLREIRAAAERRKRAVRA